MVGGYVRIWDFWNSALLKLGPDLGQSWGWFPSNVIVFIKTMYFILSFLIKSLVRITLLVLLVFFLLLLFFGRWSIFITVDFVKFLKPVLRDYAGLIFIINRLWFHWLNCCAANSVIIILRFLHKLSHILFIEVINTLDDPSFHHIRALRASLREWRSLAGCVPWAGLVILSLRYHSWEDWGRIFETIITRHMPHTLRVNDRFGGLLTWVRLNLTCRWVFQLLIKSVLERCLRLPRLLTRCLNWDAWFCVLCSQLIILDVASMLEIFFGDKDLDVWIRRGRRFSIFTFKFVRKMTIEYSTVRATFGVTRGPCSLKLAFCDITSCHWNRIQRNVMWVIVVHIALSLLQRERTLEVVRS